ncbi:hypothetical protein [Streptosporangium amethystogenes]|uniref:hypothetical protein n=1 Tax=Streptosporangium amethystogenes TaxID=2002 RepID=UPI0004C6AE22|nr:hypothetical protein [Streptosporangium amethystogenes]
MTYGETDELSFGGEREPRLRTWVAAHRRLLAITVAVAVVVAGLGTGGWYLHRRSLLPSPPPDGALPPAVGFGVLPCLEKSTFCEEGPLEQTAALVRGIPEVASSRVITYEEILARAGRILPTGEEQPEQVWPPQIEGRLRRTEDYEAVSRQLVGKPGVRGVYRFSENFWKGKADLQVNLCGNVRVLAACLNGAATAAQRDAVVVRLREQDGVEEVFFQDQAFALWLSRHYPPETYRTTNDVSEQLYARLDDPARAEAVGRAVLGMPGVESANMVR